MLKYVLAQVPLTVLGTVGVFLLMGSAHTGIGGAWYEPKLVYLGTITLLVGVCVTAMLIFGCAMLDVFAWLSGRKDRAVFQRETAGKDTGPIRGI